MWLSKAGRRWFDLVAGIASLATIVAFALTTQYVFAWVALGAMFLLVVSVALTARDEHAARLAAEGHDSQAVLDRAIDEGHKMLESGQWFTGNLWLEWQDRTADVLREHIGSLQAHQFMGARSGGEGLRGMTEAQVAYLEGLRKRR